MYQKPDKQGMRKVHMMVTVTTTPDWHSQLTHDKIEVIHQQQVKSDVMNNTNTFSDT